MTCDKLLCRFLLAIIPRLTMQTRTRRLLWPLLMSITLLLAGCIAPVPISTLEVGSVCLPTATSFAYQTSGESQDEPEMIPVLPQQPWVIETDLPTFPDNSIPSTRRNWILGAFPASYESWNIWVLRSWSNDPTKGEYDSMDLVVYNTVTGQWTTVPAHVSEVQAITGELFMTPDGAIWARNYPEGFLTIFEPPHRVGLTQFNSDPSADMPLLSKYNEAANQFEPVESTQIPASQLAGEWNKVLLDNEGTFWVLVQGDGIYRFSPDALAVSRHADLSSGAIRSVFMDSTNQIFFSDDFSAVFRFSSATGLTEKVGGIPLPLDNRYNLSFHGILIDHSNRLWVGNLGWAEPDEYRTWYQLFPAPIFVTRSEGSALYSQENPRLMLESVDGKLWYQFTGGAALLDPKAEKWCWFTTEQSNIVEDQQHNLWMVADNKLFKLYLTP